jgi:Protein of unknown function (DUF1367)
VTQTTVALCLGQDGRLTGADHEATAAYADFRRRVRKLKQGDTIMFTWADPRSPEHHRLWMQKVKFLLSCTEAFTQLSHLRQWLTTGAGYVRWEAGPDGAMQAVPQSLAFETMPEAEFRALHARVDGFLWSSHARHVLWPHLDDAQTHEAVATVMAEFDREGACC